MMQIIHIFSANTNTHQTSPKSVCTVTVPVAMSFFFKVRSVCEPQGCRTQKTYTSCFLKELTLFYSYLSDVVHLLYSSEYLMRVCPFS